MKKNLKKFLFACLAAILVCGSMTACGAGGRQVSAAGDDRLSVVTTIFPEYDWVRNILGESPAGAELTMLLDSGVDLHSFQPSAEDILKISDCDVFIYVGGESDGWVEDVLKEASNKDMQTINLLEILGDKVKEEEVVEGMEAEEEGEEEEEGPEYDEHVWLSLKNAKLLVNAISGALGKADPANEELYRMNAADYADKLDKLDADYEAAVKASAKKTLLFGDRFPFRYMTDDYGLSYYAAFAGCSAETEASFETVMFLAQKVDELSLDSVMVIESGDGRIAQTVIDNTKTKDAKILKLDSIQSVTAKDVEAGTSYLALMEGNLEVLKEALK